MGLPCPSRSPAPSPPNPHPQPFPTGEGSFRARIIELARLPDDDGASADDEDRGDVSAFGHYILPESQIVTATPRTATRTPIHAATLLLDPFSPDPSVFVFEGEKLLVI